MARPRNVKPKWAAVPKRGYGAGSISRNQTTGILRARLPARIDPKRASREFAPDDLTGATAWLDTEVARATSGQQHTPATTVRDWSGYWWETSINGSAPPNTARHYLWSLKKLEPVYDVGLGALRKTRLQSVVKDLATQLAPDTLSVVLVVWRRCFEAAIDDELIGRNPSRGLTFERGAKADTEQRTLTVKELGLLRGKIRTHRFEPVYVLILEMGLRIGEALGLHWRYVDFAGRRVWVKDQYTNGHWRSLPKGKNPHWAPMPEDVATVLIRHRDRQPPGSVLVMQSPHQGKGAKKPTPWSYNTVRNDLMKILASLGLDDVTLHTGRHSLVTHWIDGGVSLAEAARRVGHADPGITAKRYVHATEASSGLASAIVDRLFPEPISPTLGNALGSAEPERIESEG